MTDPLKIANRLMALASPAAESLSDKQRIDEFVDAAIEAAGVIRNLCSTKQSENLKAVLALGLGVTRP